MKLYAYKNGSASAKALAAALGIKRIKHNGKVWSRVNELIINWGSSSMDGKLWYAGQKVLNDAPYVEKASNKLETFKALEGVVPIPEWTEDVAIAAAWLPNGNTVVCRAKLNGHSGDGISLVDAGGKLPLVPLYTKYIKKKEEYRLHVFQDECIFVQRKARKKDVPDDQVDWKIRNHKNGFIYAHQGVDVPEDVKQISVKAVKALGLDFGAVDIILGTDRSYYVLEVNTACGLEGETLNRYVEKFNNLR